VATDAVDGFLAIHADGTVTLFSARWTSAPGAGGTPADGREELDVPIERITMIEGDTALTPDQGPPPELWRGTWGMQIRRAAATARQALLDRAAQRLGRRSVTWR